jgi:hypothetical protein
MTVWVLTYLAIYVTAPLVLPVEVAPLTIVPMESLARSSLLDLEVDRLAHDLEMGVGDALGMSLSEVHARYFRDSDKGEDSEVGQDLVEEHNYGNVITNHHWCGWYQTEDIDVVPYMSYREDAVFK